MPIIIPKNNLGVKCIGNYLIIEESGITSSKRSFVPPMTLPLRLFSFVLTFKHVQQYNLYNTTKNGIKNNDQCQVG